MLQSFRKVLSELPGVNEMQDAIKSVLDPVTRHVLLQGNLLRSVALMSGANTLNHGLGRKYVSWLHGNESAAATLTVGTSPDPTKYLVVVASEPITCDLYVF